MARKQAREIADRELKPSLEQQVRNDLQRQADDARLAHLKRTNPAAYVQEIDRIEAQRRADGQRNNAAVEHLTRTYAEAKDLIGQRLAALPANIRQAIVEAIPEDKQYDGSFSQGLSAYFDDVLQSAVKAAREDAVKNEVSKALKAERDALRKEILAELNGTEDSLDLAAGEPTANTGGDILARYNSPSTTAAERRAIRSDPTLGRELEAALRGAQQRGR